jgi:hypothetical protein
MEVHLVNIALMNRDTESGRIYQRGQGPGTIKQSLNFDTEARIVTNPNVPNSNDNPTLEEYLILEAASGFQPVQVDQTFVITLKP